MTHGEALIHGDLHTGSVMVGGGRAAAIDPEFAFYGPVGFDLGALWANAAIAASRADRLGRPEAFRAHVAAIVRDAGRRSRRSCDACGPSAWTAFFETTSSTLGRALARRRRLRGHEGDPPDDRLRPCQRHRVARRAGPFRGRGGSSASPAGCSSSGPTPWPRRPPRWQVVVAETAPHRPRGLAF